MEPEMYQSMVNSEKIGSNDDVNLVMQIGRSDRQLSRIMRPFHSFPETDDNWSGVKRYYIKNPKSILIEDLGKVNMAHPKTLYEFIKWGVKNYKANHYMLVLSDHGVAYIGGLTDLTFNVPYIMGIPEMAKAIHLIKEELNHQIDILLLDMCYMNSIEVIYEFGKEQNTTVKNILTYIDQGPFEGLSYDKLIFLTEKYSKINNLNWFLEYLIDNLNYNLVACDINHEKLEKLKKSFNDLAYYYLNNKTEDMKDPTDLMKPINSNSPFLNYIKNINDNLTSIIIYSTKDFNGQPISINTISTDKDKLIFFYNKLAFAKNNYWTCLQVNNLLGKNLNSNIELVKNQYGRIKLL